MEIRNLRTFLKVAALQNFTQASKELGYAQSNVSTQIQQLEQEVGAPLFNRIGRSVSLTQYGEEMLPYAHQIVSLAQQMEHFLKSAEALGGVIKVGIVESLFALLTPEFFMQYHRQFPRVKQELTVDGTSVLKEAVRRGTLDLACLIDHPLNGMEWQRWYAVDVPIVIAANPLHPLAAKEEVAWEALEDQTFVVMEDSAPYSIQFQQILSEHHTLISPFLKLQNANMARELVKKGMFLSVLPYYAIRQAVQEGSICVLRLPGAKQMQSVQIILHSSKVVIPQMEGLMQAMREVLHKEVAESLPS